MNNKYQVKITGKNIKRFIKDLIQLKIKIYDLKIQKNTALIIVDDRGLTQIKKIKTSYQISIQKLYGLVKYKNIIKKYRFFLLASFLGIILIYTLSNLIFSIEVEHEKQDIRDLILTDLENFGIKKYHFQVSYKEKEKIKKKILAKETNKIEWLEIEKRGTKYIVKVEERIKNEVKKEVKYQNIIAKKDAMLLKISAVHGEVKKKKYDYVKKGDVLISGLISRDEKIVSKTKADGIVFGEVWYKVIVDLPKKYKTVEKTGNNKKMLELKIFNQSIFMFSLSPYKTYTIDRNLLFKNSIIPISINYSKIYETKVTKKNYQMSNVKEAAIKIASNKLKEKLGPKDKIISKKVLKKTEKNSRIIVEVFFKVEEDIKDIENIEDIKIEDIEGGESNTSN